MQNYSSDKKGDEQMDSSLLPNVRIAKKYLRNWFYLDKHFDSLGFTEKLQAKILLESLNKLEVSELQFIGSRYYVKTHKGKDSTKDIMQARKHGLQLKAYKTKKLGIEIKLNDILKENISLYRRQLNNAIRLDRLNIK